MYVLVWWWLVNCARYGEVAGTSLAYRTVSDQKVNWVQGSGEDWATIHRRMGLGPVLTRFSRLLIGEGTRLSCLGGAG